MMVGVQTDIGLVLIGMIWFDRLEEKYGSAEAKLLWKSAWDKQDSWESKRKLV